MLYTINNKFGLTLDEVRVQVPNVSIPINSHISGEINSYDETPTPTYDPLTHSVREIYPANKQQCWEIYELPEDIANENKSQFLETAKNNIRTQRNMLLAASDWTQLNDSKVDKEAWAAYRQKLRDITNQTGFPLDVEFPTLT